MSFYRVHRRFAAWLAMWAMVFGALAPALAQAAVAASDKAQLIEVCGASGVVWVKANGSGVSGSLDGAFAAASDQDPALETMGGQCLWCASQGGSFALLPEPIAPLPVAPSVQTLPEAPRVAQNSKGWRNAQARAPPLGAQLTA